MNCNRLCSAPPSPQPSDVLHASLPNLRPSSFSAFLAYHFSADGHRMRETNTDTEGIPGALLHFCCLRPPQSCVKESDTSDKSSLRDFCLLGVLTGEKRIHRKEPHNLTTSHAAAATASGFLRQFAFHKQMLERDEKHLFLIKMSLLSHITILII